MSSSLYPSKIKCKVSIADGLTYGKTYEVDVMYGTFIDDKGGIRDLSKLWNMFDYSF
jgi:hypothetical protein